MITTAPARGAVRQVVPPVAVLLVLFAVVAFWPLAVSAARDSSLAVRMAVDLAPFVVMFGAVALAVRAEGRTFSSGVAFSTRHLGRQLVIALVLAAITLSFVLIPWALGVDMIGGGEGETGPLAFLYTAVRTFVLVSIGEELIWRGYVFESIRRAGGSGVLAVLLSSALFGLWHYPGSEDVLRVIVTAIFGAVWATARLRVRHCSTFATGVAHGVHDLALLVLATFAV